MPEITSVLPTNAFDHVQMGAGVILSDFSTDNWTVDAAKIIGATKGGMTFTDVVEWKDFGEDIDNCPKNTKELKKAMSHEVKLAGTYVSATPELMKRLIGTADYSSKKITPRNNLSQEDFADVWFVCEYGDSNAIAIHMIDALNTSGLSLKTTDGEKGEHAFEYTAHYSMNNQDKVPYEIFVKE